MPTWDSGRLHQAYIKDESSYGTSPTFASTDAKRVMSLTLPYNAQNLRPSPERRTDPSQRAMFRGRRTASWDLKAMLYPSGILNTLPELNTVLKNAFGAAPSNITLAATVLTAASSPAEAAPTTTAFAITDFTGLVVGQFVQITLSTGANAGTYLRMLTTIAAAAGTTPKKLITVSPALPAAPILADTVKGSVTYAPATANSPTSMSIGYYANWSNREMNGALADKLSLMFDANLEPMIQVSGAAAALATSPQAQPGAFTTVGADNAIPSGLYGYFYYGATLYQIEKMQIDMTNGFDTQNTALGTAFATGAFRKGKRGVGIKIDAKVSDDLTMYTPSLVPGPTAPSENTLMLQIGTTAAQMWAVYCPRVIFNATPNISDGDETNNFSFDLTALATSGNDEIFLGAG